MSEGSVPRKRAGFSVRSAGMALMLAVIAANEIARRAEERHRNWVLGLFPTTARTGLHTLPAPARH